jgi:hypothetical protein
MKRHLLALATATLIILGTLGNRFLGLSVTKSNSAAVATNGSRPGTIAPALDRATEGTYITAIGLAVGSKSGFSISIARWHGARGPPLRNPDSSYPLMSC